MVTIAPMDITNTLPAVSDIFPLKGLLIRAMAANEGIINQAWASPFNCLSNTGNSGKTMEKLEKNTRLARQSFQNAVGYAFAILFKLSGLKSLVQF